MEIRRNVKSWECSAHCDGEWQRLLHCSSCRGTYLWSHLIRHTYFRWLKQAVTAVVARGSVAGSRYAQSVSSSVVAKDGSGEESESWDAENESDCCTDTCLRGHIRHTSWPLLHSCCWCGSAYSAGGAPTSDIHTNRTAKRCAKLQIFIFSPWNIPAWKTHCLP